VIELACGACCCLAASLAFSALLRSAAKPARRRRARAPALDVAVGTYVPGKQAADNYGITRFQWSTAGDPGVCEECRALDGKIFLYAEPPPQGLPGEREGCRCTDLAVLPDDDVAELLASGRARAARESAQEARGEPVPRRQTCSDPMPKRPRRRRSK